LFKIPFVNSVHFVFHLQCQPGDINCKFSTWKAGALQVSSCSRDSLLWWNNSRSVPGRGAVGSSGTDSFGAHPDQSDWVGGGALVMVQLGELCQNGVTIAFLKLMLW